MTPERDPSSGDSSVEEPAVEQRHPQSSVWSPPAPPAGLPSQRAQAHEATLSAMPAPLNLIGLVLSDVCVERPLAEGGMSTLYVGRHIRLGRSWVVKVGNVGTAALQWFEQEALVTSLLRENGERRVPEVLALGALSDGRPYMVMELIPGRSLEKVLADAPSHRLPLVRALKILYRVTDTLERAHKLGIVHRDIKPANIMVEDRHGHEESNVRVLDWGIAHASGITKQVQTVTGMLVGTPGYLSPEGTFGEPTDGRSDVFSVACLMYEMLTGKSPFGEGDWMERINATRGVDPAPVDSFRSDFGRLGRDVSALAALGLSKDPRQRPAMDVFRTALLGVMEKIEGRRRPNAPSPLATMLSAEVPRALPLPERPTHAREDVDGRDFLVRAIAPAPTRQGHRQPPQSRVSTGGIAIVATLVLGAAAGTYAVTSRRAPASARQMPNNTTPAAPAESAGARPSMPRIASVPQPSGHVHVVTNPAGASVTVDGHLVGHSPMDVTGPRDQLLRVRIELKGYAPREEMVLPSTDGGDAVFGLLRARALERPSTKNHRGEHTTTNRSEKAGSMLDPGNLLAPNDIDDTKGE